MPTFLGQLACRRVLLLSDQTSSIFYFQSNWQRWVLIVFVQKGARVARAICTLSINTTMQINQCCNGIRRSCVTYTAGENNFQARETRHAFHSSVRCLLRTLAMVLIQWIIKADYDDEVHRRNAFRVELPDA
jgi:hypothetical protein